MWEGVTMMKPTFALVSERLSARFASTRLGASLVRFRDDESGVMAFFVMLMFLLMITFGGIAVDVMRFETRRVAMQQTLDRAALAAASLTQTRTPKQVVEDWFLKAGLEEELLMVDFSAPTVAAVADAGLRRVTVSADVRSYNYFMTIFSNNDYLESLTTTEAAQGVSEIEVIMVLDITGSMGEQLGDGRTKIQALRTAAQDFVTIVKQNDKKNGVSIGVVPYAAQVNIPVNLRQQFTVQDLSHWNGQPLQGVPNINCFEFPTSGFGTTGVSLTSPIRMAAVADANSGTTTDGSYVGPQAPNASSRACTTNAETGSTPWVDSVVNHVMLPTKDGEAVKTKINRLTAAGNTYIAVGMRWGTALIDEAARPIYTAIGDSTVQGRPADNASNKTRKIIILMTDGEHVTNNHIRDGFKTGLSPIWRGSSDGRFAIRFTNGGSALTGGTRPSCSNGNTYFVPHLQSGSSCSSAAWRSSPSWSGSGTVRQLDWSEVWHHVRVSWVAQQLYQRSNVTGATYSAAMSQFRTTYLTNVATMNSLLQTNCTAARNAGIEIYGIAFAAPANGQTQINGCSSSPKENYYFNAADSAKLSAAFRMIAIDISELRLTQ